MAYKKPKLRKRPTTSLKSVEEFNKSQKFVRLLEWMRHPEGIRADTVMNRFKLDARTMRRYMADLHDMGIPVIDQGRGSKRVLRLDPRYVRQGVQLSLLEAVSLEFGRTLFDFLGGTQFAEDMDGAIVRLSRSLGRLGTRKTADLQRKFMAVPEHGKDHRRSSDLLDDILSAVINENPANACYARLTGPEKDYELHPYTLVTYRQSLYLFALDLEEERVKTFALDRFKSFEPVRGEHFQFPKNFKPRDIVRDAFGIIGGPVEEVILHFRPAITPYVRERRWHHSQTVMPSGDGGVILRMNVAVSPELRSWILGFGPDVRVLAPASLAEEIRQLHFEAAE